MIPYGRQEITEKDIDAVVDVLRSDFLTQGPNVPNFEKQLCKHANVKYSVAVNSCTSALHIACLALELGPGDILWTSPISFVASANCGLYCGASVDFVDVDIETGLMSVEHLECKLKLAAEVGNLPKIVVPVHFAGQPCDMEGIYNLSKKYGFSIIEDAAHAIGAHYKDEPVGKCRYSQITVFSFHPVKIITTGEGGSAMTNDAELYERMLLLRSHGITRDPKKMSTKSQGQWYYEQIALGYNYRMTDIQAALGVNQLRRLNEYVSKRQKISKWYDKEFKDDNELLPLLQKNNRISSYHLYVIRVNGGEVIRNKLFNGLRDANIAVNLHYIPVYNQPFYRKNAKLYYAEEYYSQAITLPLFPGLTINDLKSIVKHIRVLINI